MDKLPVVLGCLKELKKTIGKKNSQEVPYQPLKAWRDNMTITGLDGLNGFSEVFFQTGVIFCHAPLFCFLQLVTFRFKCPLICLFFLGGVGWLDVCILNKKHFFMFFWWEKQGGQTTWRGGGWFKTRLKHRESLLEGFRCLCLGGW